MSTRIRRLLCLLALLTFVSLVVYLKVRPEESSMRSLRKKSHDKTCQIRNFTGPKYTKLLGVAKEFGSICHDRKCHAAFEAAIDRTERVPKIRHILWKTERVSTYFAKQLNSWLKIHPNWTYVLWRDQDLEGFVAKYYPGVLQRFRSLKHHIMRVDMIRYLILHHFGGVYADLDYVLVRPLDWFLKYPATVPITAEAIAMFFYGLKWPPDRLANPAFMISEPQHPFFSFCILKLAANPTQDIFRFAGPLGLSTMVKQYAADFPATADPGGIVLVPPSRAFDAFANNSFWGSTTSYQISWIKHLNHLCKVHIKSSKSPPVQLKLYCNDVYNLDPITDKNDLSYAVHDTKKTRTSYDPKGSPVFFDNTVDVRRAVPNILMANQIY